MLTCTNNNDPRRTPWLVVILVVLVVVIGMTKMPPHLIDYLLVSLLVVLMGSFVGVVVYQLEWAEN